VRRWAGVLALGLLASACVKRVDEAAPARTVVFVAKAIRTLDPAHPVVQALAMREGKVLAVGTRSEVLAAAGPSAALEEFPRATIVPGLADAHGHLLHLGQALLTPALGPAPTEAAAVALVQVSGQRSSWLVGRGWDQNRWPGHALPTRASLDAAFPSTPVVLTRVDGHAVWVNGEALRRSGITRASPEPDGGRIVRDAAGEPTGVLVDNAIDLVHPPEPTLEERQRALKLALETCARLGLTSVHDAGMDLATLRVLQQWDMLGALPTRVYAMVDGQDAARAEEFLGLGRSKGRRLEVRAVKLVLDGSLGSRSAALTTPYADEPSQRGLLLLSPEVFDARARAFAEAGFQVAVHAIGDRAANVALGTLTAISTAHPDARPRLEHAQVLAPADLTRLAEGHVIASMQPTHATSDMGWAEARLGSERVRWAYAWRAVLDAGGRLAFGSDFPVEAPNPLWGLYAARTRTDHAGQPAGGWFPSQRLSGQEALEGFTTGAAFASFAEHQRGRLAPGFDADFVVLPVDPVDDLPESLIHAPVLVTVVDGIDVYRAPH
jgi:hypothetical protein